MNMMDFAKSELELLEENCKDDAEALEMQKAVTRDVLSIIQTFVNQKHSGFSADYVLKILDKLLRYKPLSPIEDREEDWEDCSEYGLNEKQHKRCPEIFKRADGTAYLLHGKIFTEDGGKSWFTTRESNIPVTFPYDVPLYSECVYLDKEEENKNEES